MKRILLVDFANSLFTQHHYKNANPTWAFINDLRKIAAQFGVYRTVFACEGGKSQYRLKMHPAYKAQREENRKKMTPADLKRYNDFKQIEMPECLAVCKALGIQQLSVKGVEADDIISYYVRNIDLSKYQVMMLTTDQDMYQLLRPGVVQAGYNKKMTEPLAGESKIPAKLWMNAKQFTGQYEIEPAQYAHVKALSGDTGDNYLSPKGLGETFALRMIQQFGSIEEVEKNIDTMQITKLPKTVKPLLKEQYETIYHNFKLANLNHSPETDLEIFGQPGLDYLQDAIARIEEEPAADVKAFQEWCFENGKVGVADRVDMWLASFHGGLSGY